MAITSAGRRKIYYIWECRALQISCLKNAASRIQPSLEVRGPAFWSPGRIPPAHRFRKVSVERKACSVPGQWSWELPTEED